MLSRHSFETLTVQSHALTSGRAPEMNGVSLVSVLLGSKVIEDWAPSHLF